MPSGGDQESLYGEDGARGVLKDEIVFPSEEKDRRTF